MSNLLKQREEWQKMRIRRAPTCTDTLHWARRCLPTRKREPEVKKRFCIKGMAEWFASGSESAAALASEAVIKM
jgi:hypothetical protein